MPSGEREVAPYKRMGEERDAKPFNPIFVVLQSLDDSFMRYSFAPLEFKVFESGQIFRNSFKEGICEAILAPFWLEFSGRTGQAQAWLYPH
jgi:hypothetical protein